MQQTTQQIQRTPQEKKSRWWIWLLIIFILVVIGLIIYFLVFSRTGEPGIFGGGGSQIPTPPPLPD